ncbi:hypothetical protein SBA7_1110012 [Candidatus Sulfotelmatobacter sp. SbA7]|nr:hypothetical protein SBA7_1110012 [Candidatus Sulfotelmatobacter sp. SbA7]
MGCFSATILENLDLHARWAVVAQMRSELDGAVDHVIAADKPADETDDDDWRRRNRIGCADWVWRVRVSSGRDEAKNQRNTTDRSANTIAHNLVNDNNKGRQFSSGDESLRSTAHGVRGGWPQGNGTQTGNSATTFPAPLPREMLRFPACHCAANSRRSRTRREGWLEGVRTSRMPRRNWSSLPA